MPLVIKDLMMNSCITPHAEQRGWFPAGWIFNYLETQNPRPLTLLLSGNYIPGPKLSYSLFVPATPSRASQKAAHFPRFGFNSQPCFSAIRGIRKALLLPYWRAETYRRVFPKCHAALKPWWLTNLWGQIWGGSRRKNHKLGQMLLENANYFI